MKAYFLLALMSLPASAAYTTMTIEGVKQANGVWTAAGVMDTQGFVRTTGAVTVSGVSRNLPVAFQADIAASSSILRTASRLAGPVALAATAYEVYDWVTSSPSIDASGNEWIAGQINTFASASSVSYYISTYGGQACRDASNCSIDSALTWLNTGNAYKPVVVTGYSKPILNPNGTYTVNMTCTSKFINGRCELVAIYPNNPYSTSDMNDRFNSLPDPSLSVLANGFNNIPSLSGSQIPIGGLTFTPFSEWLGSPYFKDGTWYRDRMDVSPCPTSSEPTRVCIDVGSQKFDGETDPTKVPSQAVGTAGGSAPKEKPEFCKANPKSIVCQEFELGELEPEPLDNNDVQFKLDTNQSWGASNSQCPASPKITLHTGEVITFNYQPTCDFLSMIRPFIMAFAILTAIFIAIGRTD